MTAHHALQYASMESAASNEREAIIQAVFDVTHLESCKNPSCTRCADLKARGYYEDGGLWHKPRT